MGKIVICEVSKKQEYIFRTSKQKENIGASYIIKDITENLYKKFLEKNEGETIFAGGGKSLFYFQKDTNAKKFAEDYTTQVLEEFSGVELFISSIAYAPEKDNVSKKMKEAYGKLDKKKLSKVSSARQIGFGITQNAYVFESESKSNYSKENRKYWSELLVGNLQGMVFPSTTDDLVLGDDKSYIAVVHIDGNSMGERFISLYNGFIHEYEQINVNIKATNERYIDTYRSFSNEVKEVYKNTFAEMLYEIKLHMDGDEKFPSIEDNVIPVIPLILAGDDVTFVCSGKIAVECMRIFIEKLENHKSEIDNKHFYACGGAAIIKKHYPFFAAYELAEKLCASAKSEIKSNQSYSEKSAIDWHIVQGECEDVRDIRKKLYSVDNSDDKLCMRPLIVSGNPSKDIWKHYYNFKSAMKIIRNNTIAVSKLKNLRNVLRRGKDFTENYVRTNKLGNCFMTLDDFGVVNPLRGAEKIGTGYEERHKNCVGFYGDTCLFFDALEIMDLYYGFYLTAEKE